MLAYRFLPLITHRYTRSCCFTIRSTSLFYFTPLIFAVATRQLGKFEAAV